MDDAAEGERRHDFVALADDEVEAAIAEINAWETENCGIEHPDEGREGASAEIDDGATRIDVTATDIAMSRSPSRPGAPRSC